MKIMVEARLVDGSDSKPGSSVPIAVIDPDDDLEQLGPTLEDGRELLAATQYPIARGVVPP